MIDLRNPEGKYGGTAKSLAALMQIMETVKQKRRERDVSDKLLKGINAGQTPDMLMASLAEPETKGKADLLTSLARAVVYPFNPMGTSRQETELERGLKRSWTSAKLDQALKGKWGALEPMGGGGFQQTHPVTGESKVHMPRAAARGTTPEQQRLNVWMDIHKQARAGVGEKAEAEGDYAWKEIMRLLEIGAQGSESMSQDEAGEMDAVTGAARPMGGTIEWQPNPNDLRPDGTQKGTGWLGVKQIALADGRRGVATEYTTQSNAVKVNGKRIDFPSLVPGLSKEQENRMLTDIIPNKKPVPEDIMQIAIAHAKKQLATGKSVFAPSGPGFFGRLFAGGGGAVENAPKGFEAFGKAGAPFIGRASGTAPKPKQPEGAVAPQEDEESAAYYELSDMLPRLDPETRRKVQELRNRGRKESDILKAVQQILSAKTGK